MVHDHQRNLSAHKSMGPNKMHTSVLRELADTVAESFCIIFVMAVRKDPGERKKGNYPFKKKGKKQDPGNN